ncbi:MAG: PaaI family thioesterase [Peptoniphilaceae bacterium]|nr:PaaI family thioesterase [Peptoniphilaceae bacterium]MDD7383868.1 PaaI family thioesterase [Peptoniphilaceae bacterium]MDY3738009.1 PaaI family thioesterase [Peptoniphilaceae bacterium]
MKNFIDYLGIEFIEISFEKSINKLYLKDEFYNLRGAIQGGVIFTLADSSSGYAANKKSKAVTLSSNINYINAGLKSKKIEYITSTASLIKAGKKTAVYDVEVKTSEGEILAKSIFTYYFLDKK